MIAKAQSMWAEYTCEAPFEQWTLGNETYAVLLDDPGDALGRAYGERRADRLGPRVVRHRRGDRTRSGEVGYEQRGRGARGGRARRAATIEFEELAAHRVHRWASRAMDPWTPPVALAHLGLRAPFRFPDGTTADLVLTRGWGSRSG